MSFSKKIEKIQKRSLKERQTVALFATSIIFVVIVLLLYAAGAFSFPSFRMPSGEADDSLTSVKEDVSSIVESIGEEFDTISASSSALIEEMKSMIASTTASTSNDALGTTTGSISATSSSEENEDKNIFESGATTTDDLVEEEKIQEEIY